MTASIPVAIRPRLGQVVRLLASDRDGEVLAAARALRRTLASVGLDLHDFADVVERAPEPVVLPPTLPRAFAGRNDEVPSPFLLIDFLAPRLASPCLTDWEASFLASIIDTLRKPRWRLSERQAELVNGIAFKLAEGER